MPRARSSRRITRASGQVSVLLISVATRRSGCSLLPVPMLLMMGTPSAEARRIRQSLAVTVSMASTMQSNGERSMASAFSGR